MRTTPPNGLVALKLTNRPQMSQSAFWSRLEEEELGRDPLVLGELAEKFQSMADFASTTPSSSPGDVNTLSDQLSGLQISSQSTISVNASSLPFESRGVALSVFEAFV